MTSVERAPGPDPITLLDCTLRDGGYYNNWDFDRALVDAYLQAMAALPVDVVELGFRSLKSAGFQGPSAFTTDRFVAQLNAPANLTLGVMISASELIEHPAGVLAALALMVRPADESPIRLIRIAAHAREVASVLPAFAWLKDRGYTAGLSLMQIADRTEGEMEALAACVQRWPVDVLYLADSTGSLDPARTAEVIASVRRGWSGAMGIHAHDNMGVALANSLCALDRGVSWVDGTVMGMGRGSGNVKTEYLAIDVAERRGQPVHISPLMTLIANFFKPLHERYGWGTNPYYFLAGKYGIHPTFIQEMLSNPRFDGVDILAVIAHLREEGGKSYSLEALDRGLNFFKGEPRSTWRPDSLLAGKDVLLIGPGPGAREHRASLEDYIRRRRPVVMALNTVRALADDCVDLRVASHPVRLLEDGPTHLSLPQPLVTPASQLPESVRRALRGKELRDFGLTVQAETFLFDRTQCVIPVSMVVPYALAIAASGGARRVLLAGFDGYPSDDPRSIEMNSIFALYRRLPDTPEILAATPSRYHVPASSIYFLGAEL